MASQPPATAHCCRCNGSAKCLRCACVKYVSTCSHCQALGGRCHNTLPLGYTLGPNTPPVPTLPPPISNPDPIIIIPTPIRSCQPPNLPTLSQSLVLTSPLFTTSRKVPWAASLSHPLLPTLLTLDKCILASPVAGHRLRWREILKSRLRRWNDGDYLGLWSEAVEKSQATSRR